MMESDILELLGRSDYVPANVPELLSGLKQPPNQQQRLLAALRELLRSGRIARIKGNRYILSREADLVPGRIQITPRGRGFLLPDEPGVKEIAVPAAETGTALHGDHVLVRRNLRPIIPQSDKQEPDTGTIVRVLERRRTQIVGTLKQGRQFLYVIPEDPRMPHDIYVPPPRDTGRAAQPGDKVVVKLRHWETRHTNPEGEITEVLGPPTAEGVDMLAVLRHYELPLKFPSKVLRDAKQFGSEIARHELSGRTDCRQHPVVTIDPEDAKDFDDAFCLKPTGSNRWKLWVHIADVTHYVRPGSALDQEASRRGNSTYLVDRVIPMLPEALSNELCSLKPRVDRLTKCVEFLIDDDGQVLKSRCYPAVIHSQRRFSYEEALAVLQGKPKDAIEHMIQSAGQLAQKLRRHRFKAGALQLDFPETKIRLDEKGRVEAIVKSVTDEAHQLIEEFMLLTNETVAGKLLKAKISSIHRVHEKPNPVRLQEYREDVLSHHIPCGNLEIPGEVQKLLKHLDSLAIGPALKIGFLKSMARARYAVDSLGHYGLAKSKYAHFTSPIRRYADLMVHRTLFEKGGPTRDSLKKTTDHISMTERNSSDAERDSKQVKLYAFLTEQLKSGKPPRYPALVIDIRNFGFFVDVSDLGMSGLVPLSLIKDDFYEFDAVRGQLRGRRNHTLIRVGDRVEVHVAKVDPFKKQVDFRLARPSKRSQAAKRKSSKQGRPAPEAKASKKAGKASKKAGKASKMRPARRRRSGQGAASGKAAGVV